MDRLKDLQENGHHESGAQVTGIHPSDRQGSYIVESSPQGAPEVGTSTSRGWEKFWLEANEVADLLKQNNMSTDDLLQSLITPASSLARPPISSYHVGAVGLGASGRLYVGVNLEFARLPINNSVHAEQFLVANALHHGEQAITKIAVSAAPCGHCRQFYSELCCADSIRFFFGSKKQSYGLADILPQRFGPADLLSDPNTPLLLQPQHNSIELTSESQELVASRNEVPFLEATKAALRQAVHSYAPYSHCPSGLAIVTAAGAVYSGPYLESAAFNPSLGPLQAAVIDAVTDGIAYYTEVQEVVLVEIRDAHVQHAANVRIILEQIAPSALLTVLLVEKSDSP
ncbi:hypothetical protein ABBQ38_006726 [Trebouxia sp. C0009 RCD-2024]